MPSVSTPQANLMAACNHGATYDKCPPKKVAAEFNEADKGRGIIHGGKHRGAAAKRILAKKHHVRV